MYSVSVTRDTDLLLVADDVRIINAEGNKVSAEQLRFLLWVDEDDRTVESRGSTCE